MKKLLLSTVFTAFFLITNAQNFGIRAGADFASVKAKFDGFTVSDTETGFYIGAFTKFKASESFKIRPEINFISIKDLNQIQVPVFAEIGLSEKFNLLAGPSFGFLLDTQEGEKSFNFGAEFGLSYDISNKFLIEARYNLGLSNLVDDNEFDASLKLHGLFVGVGYMF